MGLCFPEFKTLLDAHAKGVRFDTVLSVAHLGLNIHPQEIQYLRSRISPQNSSVLDDYHFGNYCDPYLFAFLETKQLDILDNSDFEQATIIHDLNIPIEPSRFGKYDAVIDGGTIEHVFNVPTALHNLMNLVKPSGRLFLSLPANNLCGHGFYQFSPEFAFRVFSEENGFMLEKAFLWEAEYPSVELKPLRRAYEIRDPAELGRRVALTNARPVVMVVQAKRITAVGIEPLKAQQSDYQARWKQNYSGDSKLRRESGFRALARRLIKSLPSSVSTPIKGFYDRASCSFYNSQSYRRITNSFRP